MKEIIMPELGEGISEATISYWHLKEGDAVKSGDDVVEIVTDKAAFNIPSNTSGKIKRILHHEGQTVKVGEVLAEIE